MNISREPTGWFYGLVGVPGEQKGGIPYLGIKQDYFRFFSEFWVKYCGVPGVIYLGVKHSGLPGFPDLCVKE